MQAPKESFATHVWNYLRYNKFTLFVVSLTVCQLKGHDWGTRECFRCFKFDDIR